MPSTDYPFDSHQCPVCHRSTRGGKLCRICRGDPAKLREYHWHRFIVVAAIVAMFALYVLSGDGCVMRP